MVLNKLKWGDFISLKKNGLRYKSRYFILLCKMADAGGVGFVVSKKHGNAVQRNCVKRQSRCLFQFYHKNYDAGWLRNLKLLIIPIVSREVFAQKQVDFVFALNHLHKIVSKECRV